MSTAPRPLPPHGSLSRHKYHGCKCETCYEGYRVYQRSRYRKQGYGTWQPYVDAEPIRQHLLALREQGIGFTQVAEIAGLHAATVGGFLYPLGANRPCKKRATPEVAEKILAVTAENATVHHTEALGTRRRLQTLAAAGWPMKTLGPHIGVHPATVARLMNQECVYGSTARAVADAYRKLAGERPEDHGVTPGTALKMRNRAARNDWPGPDYWDDDAFDDPEFIPATSDELGRNQVGALRRQEIAHLASYGIPEHQIADRLGMARDYVHDLIRDMHKERLASTRTYEEAA